MLSPAIREIQIKTTMGYLLTPTERLFYFFEGKGKGRERKKKSN